MYLLWLALYLGAPQYVHHCPEHSAAQLPAAAASHEGGHGDHGTTSEKSDEEGHKCCCPGPQCGTATLIVPVDGAIESVVPTLEAQRPPVRVELPRTTRDAHVLPFATAPPAPTN